ncbi:hypothetical protein [Streptomyces sp. NPDC058595]|uniref:hypothetical protein n=1 Tax=Streptomyces sp. NPDC058595 TaxID=3346550 RepID=UPI00365F36E2
MPDIPSLISAARAAQHRAARAALARGLRHPATRVLLASAAMAAATAYQAGHRVRDIHHHDWRFSDK